MKRKKFLIVASLFFLISSAGAPINATRVHGLSGITHLNLGDLTDESVNEYYKGVEGLKGEALQSKLHEIIRDHTSFTYAKTVDIMKITDRDWTLSPLSNEELVNYPFEVDEGIGDPYLRLLYGEQYNGTENAVKWSENHTTIWNKEHTWAKSHGDFGESRPAGTDLHHLIAADAQINRYHSNIDFGEPTKNITQRSDVRGNLTTSSNGDNDEGYKVFAPPLESRGDVARALFYMPTRYFNFVSTGEPKLIIVDEFSGETHAASASEPGRMAWLSVLLKWHKDDPVDAYEVHRNNLIYNNFQGNRNPFIDHPEWVDMIYDPNYEGEGASLAAGSACTIDYCAFSGGKLGVPTPPTQPEEPSLLPFDLGIREIIVIGAVAVVLLIIIIVIFSRLSKKQQKKVTKKATRKAKSTAKRNVKSSIRKSTRNRKK